MNNFNELFQKPHRHRFIWLFIKLAVVLYIFLSLEDAKAILYYVFRLKVSGKTISQWSKKFPINLSERKIAYGKNETVILFTDEKFIKIKKKKAYWWSIKDHLGNRLASIITYKKGCGFCKETFQTSKTKYYR